ncbi:MAG: DNA primase, partial [Bacteroidota bacterium]
MINQTTIEEIKSRMDIVDVVGDFVSLKKSGQNYKALSPFNNEKTPSFYVVPSKGIFKDFSSGKGGDSITFLMEIDGSSYIEALKYLAKKYGVEIVEEEKSDEFMQAQNERESLFIVLNFAKDYYKELLWENEEGKSIGLSYFRERGFSEETIREFDLGYSLDKWDGLIKAADEKGYRQEYLEKAGLKIVKENKAYDRFRGRVIFPIHNITGKVVAFGARILIKDKKQPKYINSPETELYHKSHVLYGIYQAKQAIRREDNCYLVEGYTDVISMHQAGVHNVVASSGTALTEDQIKLISRFTNNITVLFDGDSAGIKAAMRGIDMILEGGLNVKAITFPEGEDPDSYSKQLSPSAFKAFLHDGATDFIKFKTSLYHADTAADPLRRAETIREIVNSIAKIPDSIKRTVYLKECSSLLDISESVIIAELNKILLKTNKDKQLKELRDSENLERQQGAVVLPPEEDLLPKVTSLETIIKEQERESLRMLINYGAQMIQDKDEEQQYLVTYFFSEIDDVNFET